jgi:dephospho-CoA kinase
VIVVGLTGGIGTGKSTVAALLRARGVPVIDADQVARDVVARGSDGLAEIVAAFGSDALTPAGDLDRAAMRARISADPAARQRLEAITHPRIRAEIDGRLAALAAGGAAHAVVEAALMVETGSYRLYPRVAVVTCSPERQLERVMARDGATADAARALIAAQLPLAEKERVADYVIRNDGDRAALEAEVERAWAALTRT